MCPMKECRFPSSRPAFSGPLCEALKPQRILDMGSGFSSFVFQAISVHRHANAGGVVS